MTFPENKLKSQAAAMVIEACQAEEAPTAAGVKSTRCILIVQRRMHPWWKRHFRLMLIRPEGEGILEASRI